ncbi:TRAP transporter small permease [Bradyrhizobium sp. 180]|uniref:TRAP transporter small permease n=1 Tax=unclassified Bradyrhizobium TaxID=2631580 RepID=UPI001FFC0FCC|nr:MULTISPECIES: TRAP transporter small permease [unclassified Bradyrhizobium]MCK1422800.1 TRAP transporter small permease [Bradyrhizobium sp. CW12]MCK1492213.1 TRAP transporter small permease [Bradyrhizobium sp. 180]MCK1532544.1 TRAP transporter small permease [Bradyrhizobium sp. 182]MCK1598975.1 TRAP transporter small permease [Bradyrhizobium sp. 164]MCK1648313.1 TRAP transporter small permease [Bradyrhizobium sp. 154]
MAKILNAYCDVLKAAVAVCLAAMVVLVFSNVVLRYIFNSGIAVSEELSRWLLVWLTFLGAIVALRQHAHLGVDTLVRALPPRGRMLCFVVSYLLMLYADWLLTLGSWKQAVLTFGDTAPASGISVGLFFYSSGLVFGVSAAAILAYDLFQVVIGAASGEDLIAVKESDGHS